MDVATTYPERVQQAIDGPLAPGARHTNPLHRCDCGLNHTQIHSRTQGRHITTAVQDGPWVFHFQSAIDTHHTQEPDAWGRREGMPVEESYVITETVLDEIERDHRIPLPPPPKPEDAVDTRAWLRSDPSTATVRRWTYNHPEIPTFAGYGQPIGWHEDTTIWEIPPEHQDAKYLALYWQHHAQLCKPFDNHDEAAEWLRWNQDLELLAPETIATKTDEPVPLRRT